MSYTKSVRGSGLLQAEGMRGLAFSGLVQYLVP